MFVKRISHLVLLTLAGAALASPAAEIASHDEACCPCIPQGGGAAALVERFCLPGCCYGGQTR